MEINGNGIIVRDKFKIDLFFAERKWSAEAADAVAAV